jgi:hypothetical protein
MTIGIVGVAFFAARLDGVLSVRIASPSCGHSANPIWVAPFKRWPRATS